VAAKAAGASHPSRPVIWLDSWVQGKLCIAKRPSCLRGLVTLFPADINILQLKNVALDNKVFSPAPSGAQSRDNRGIR